MSVYKFKCSGCGSTQCEKDDNGYRCIYCGNVQDVIFPEEKKEEPKPQREMYDGDDDYVPPRPMDKKTGSLIIRLIVCLFAGALGAHRFMEGKILSGLLYLFTGGLFGIGMFIDAIKYVVQLAHSRDIDGD